MTDVGGRLPQELQRPESPSDAQGVARKKGTKAYPKRRLAPRAGRKKEAKGGQIGLHWVFIGTLFLLVVALSFLTFFMLPDHGNAAPHQALKHLRSLKATPELPPAPPDEQLGVQLPRPTPALWQPPSHVPPPAPSATPPPQTAVQALLNRAQAVAESMVPAALREPLSPAAKEWAAMVTRAEAAAASRGPSEAGDRSSGVPPEPRKAAVSGAAAVFEGDAWLQAAVVADGNELIFSAWIYLPDVPVINFPPFSPSSKTIASTKVAGCSNDHAPGWSLYVHELGTHNRQLRLSWSGPSGCCLELASSDHMVPFDKWTLVGFSISKVGSYARLFVDGQVVADTARDHVRRDGHPVTGPEAAMQRDVMGGMSTLCIGAYCQPSLKPTTKPQRGHRALPTTAPTPEFHIFVGYIGDMRLVHPTATVTPEEASWMMVADPEELIGSGVMKYSSYALQVQFRLDADTSHMMENLVGGASLQRQQPDHKDDSPVTLEAWLEKPQHPLTGDTGVKAGPSGPTLEPGELKGSWPEAWTKAFSEDELLQSQREADRWADEVRDAMRHTWVGYRMRAWGRDELRPVSGKPKDWCRLAITMLDGLSTLWLMGLHQEFNDAADYLKANAMPSKGKHGMHSMFEINIRALGGLLSAYSLSGNPVFLDTAKRVGDALLPSFKTESGIPNAAVDVGTGDSGKHSWQGKRKANIILAEPTTLQVEFRYLSHATGDPVYQQAADKAMDVIAKVVGQRGIVPIYLAPGNPPAFQGKKISLGAMGDSYYEYLLKQWIQTGKKEDRFKDMWKRAMADMISHLVMKTKGGRTFIAEQNNEKQVARMDHLTCFVGGMLMLGSNTLPRGEVNPYWVQLAADVGETCYEMYRRTPTGLSPEYTLFRTENGAGADMAVPQDAPHNLLRPEAIETLYYLHYYTGDPKYRRWAYEMFSAFQKHCKVRFGYSAIGDVRKQPPTPKDSQESFWLAETLKYFYLIFAPRNTLSLEEFVLNTEAQPMRVWS